jgi:hypothetical protein
VCGKCRVFRSYKRFAYTFTTLLKISCAQIFLRVMIKVKVKVLPRTGHEGPEEE